MAQLELPVGFELDILPGAGGAGRIYIKSNGKYIVTQTNGQRKYVRGTEAASVQKATRWACAFSNGSHSGNYEVEGK